MKFQHAAMIGDRYTAQEMQSQENRAWLFFIYLAIAFAFASVVLYCLISPEDLGKLSHESKATLEKMPLIAFLFAVCAISTRFSSRVRMFLYDKYVVDSLRGVLPLFVKFYYQNSILIKASAVDDCVFFCNKPRKPFYVWAVTEASDINTGLEGYAVFHYDVSRSEQLWMPVNLFIAGSIEECASKLQKISEQLNARQELYLKCESKRKRYPVEEILTRGEL